MDKLWIRLCMHRKTPLFSHEHKTQQSFQQRAAQHHKSKKVEKKDSTLITILAMMKLSARQNVTQSSLGKLFN